jgi:REP-associated tyrosine transposase
MDRSKDLQHGRHCVSAMHVHLVSVTKYRRCILDGGAIEALRRIFSKVCTGFEAQIQIDGESEWSPSYFAASCAGAPLDIIKRHMEQQATPLSSRLTRPKGPGLRRSLVSCMLPGATGK